MLEGKLLVRQSQWTESVALGSPEYIEALHKQLESESQSRERLGVEDGYQLKEAESAYAGFSGGQKGGLSLENSFFWNQPLPAAMTWLGPTPSVPKFARCERGVLAENLVASASYRDGSNNGSHRHSHLLVRN